MKRKFAEINEEYLRKLKLLMLFRVVFAALLLGSTILFRIRAYSTPMAPPLLFLYGITIGILGLSIGYSAFLNRVGCHGLLASLQLIVDTFIVTFIIYLTGGFISVFTFLYLVVIIYSSMLLPMSGILILAAICGVEYGLLVFFEFHRWLTPFGMPDAHISAQYRWAFIVFKVASTSIASFAVAFLSSFLAAQERRTRKELDMLNEHFKRVEKMAVIGEMAAGMAHEIKNPLASLAGSIQLLRESVDYDPVQDKLMHIILREADRLSNLVNDFLRFAKPQKPTHISTIDVNKAVGEIVDFFRQDELYRKRIAVEVQSSPGLCVEMDADHFRQIFWNVLLNAAQSIEEKGVVDIRIQPMKESRVAITITDTGSGIPEDHLEMIFDPFFTTKPKGTGLGLSIVLRILDVYGGRLDVKSQPGQGSAFTIVLNRELIKSDDCVG